MAKKRVRVSCFNIKWDTDGEEIDLPKRISVDVPVEVTGDNDELEDYLSDFITDFTGWCHGGFQYTVA